MLMSRQALVDNRVAGADRIEISPVMLDGTATRVASVLAVALSS